MNRTNRFAITRQSADTVFGVDRYGVENARTFAEVDVTASGEVYCRDCPGRVAAVEESQSCRHAKAVRRAIASGRISLPVRTAKSE